MKLPDPRCPPRPDPRQETRTARPAAPGVLTCTGSQSASRQTGPPSASPGWTPAKRIGRAEREAAWPRWRGRQPPRSESRPRTAQVRGRRLPGPQGSGRVCGMVSVSAAGGADSALILRTVHAPPPSPERAGSPHAGRGPCACPRRPSAEQPPGGCGARFVQFWCQEVPTKSRAPTANAPVTPKSPCAPVEPHRTPARAAACFPPRGATGHFLEPGGTGARPTPRPRSGSRVA